MERLSSGFMGNNFNWNLYEEWSHSFVCPHCGKKFPIEEAEVFEEITDSQYKGFGISGRTVTHKFLDTHHKVRFCHKCAKRREAVRKWTNIFIWIIAPTLLTILFTIRGWKDIDNLAISIIASLFVSYLTSAIVIAIPLSWILKWLYFDIDVEKASRENALESYW